MPDMFDMLEKMITALLLFSILIVTFLFFVVPDLFLSEGDSAIASDTLAETASNLPVEKAQRTSIKPSTITGFDWQLPGNTHVEPYSGLVDEIGEPSAYANVVFVRLRWDQLNPARNRFDFSSLESALQDAGEKKLVIRLEVNSACETPRWALKLLRSTKRKSLVFWDKQYPELLKPLIETFAKKYAANPRISGVHLGIGDGEYNGSCSEFSNKDGWGEFWMTDEELLEAEDHFDLTADLFIKKTKQIIDIYANAFGKYKGKLAFTNLDPYFSWGDRSAKYDSLMPGIASYVLAKGLGNRDGAVEVWMRYLYDSYGMFFKKHPDNTCSLEMDESFANKIKGRYWGTENEFYGTEKYILDTMGPRNNQAYRFMVSSLRALQMRRNHMLIHSTGMSNLDHPDYKTQDFLKYLEKTLGKQINNTPDAFVLLGERYINADRVAGYSKSGEACVHNNQVTVRSFGRWLTEKSNSAPAIKISMPESEKKWEQGAYLPDSIDYEYSARMGDHFSFDLNNQLTKSRCNKGCQAMIKVTFKDTHASSMILKMVEGQTHPYKTQGDGKIKTVSFKVYSRFNDASKGNDFMLSMKEKMPIIMVRVVFSGW